MEWEIKTTSMDTSILVVLRLNTDFQTEIEVLLIPKGMLIPTLNIKSNPKSKAPAAQ